MESGTNSKFKGDTFFVVANDLDKDEISLN